MCKIGMPDTGIVLLGFGECPLHRDRAQPTEQFPIQFLTGLCILTIESAPLLAHLTVLWRADDMSTKTTVIGLHKKEWRRLTCGGPYFFSLLVHRWHLLPMNAAMMLQYSHVVGCETCSMRHGTSTYAYSPFRTASRYTHTSCKSFASWTCFPAGIRSYSTCT